MTTLNKEILEWIGEDYTPPYERKSPFPNESVDYHLKSYGHLPQIGCCRNDQLPKESINGANHALADLRTKAPELEERVVNILVERTYEEMTDVVHANNLDITPEAQKQLYRDMEHWKNKLIKTLTSKE